MYVEKERKIKGIAVEGCVKERGMLNGIGVKEREECLRGLGWRRVCREGKREMSKGD